MPRVKDRAKRVVLAMREAVNLDKESSSVLEFACGPGVVCREILPHVKDIIGVDISTAAVERCNQRFKEIGANENCVAIEANILTDKDALSGKQFDLVYCASAYHHEITRNLSSFLKPDGALIVVHNLAKGDPGEEVVDEHRTYVMRFGFNEEDMRTMFATAGMKFVSFAEVPKDEKDNDIFIAKGILGSSTVL
ncbi:S-adenosyl-L-methionine-dependent methyltransferase [Coprinellus micaceus]|uniref:S-adenosyl-L-methionine-dependent methyltransferase n=1 Tax=Coprinellus micaceus TaxID=71717 RepID=A0A4Y7TB91_COPMI|nr:S-adenosyl-L-methionine-dependent methyltransferase [Coprinellus micaceus]